MNFNVDKVIGKNFEANIRKTRRTRNMFIAGIPLGFICFGLGGAFSAIFGMGFMALAIFGFILLPTSVIVMSTLTMRLQQMYTVKNTIDLIKSQDVVFIYQITGGNPMTDLQTVATLQKLIEKGNLEGYTLIGNLAVAKTSLGLTERDVKEQYLLLRFGKTTDDGGDNFGAPGSLTDYAQKTYDKVEADTKECYFCHTKVPADATYCSKCGARLNN